MPGVRRVFPDLNGSITKQISEGEWVGVNVYRIRDGKIIEHGGPANLFDPFMKAGVFDRK
jgi:predicted SnoaL-like aldol condensation-catalyzing enzyme